MVVVGADRGLAGAFNTSVLRAADEVIRQLSGHGPRPAVIAVGRKVVTYFNFRGRPLAARFDGFADRPRFEDAQRVVAAITEQVENADVGEIHVVSTRFLSVGSQRVQTRRLVPMDARHRREGRDSQAEEAV